MEDELALWYVLGWPVRIEVDVDITAAWLWDDGVPNEWTQTGVV